jgi:hypothetical protein
MDSNGQQQWTAQRRLGARWPPGCPLPFRLVLAGCRGEGTSAGATNKCRPGLEPGWFCVWLRRPLWYVGFEPTRAGLPPGQPFRGVLEPNRVTNATFSWSARLP